MNEIKFILLVLFLLVFYTVLTKIWMDVANFIGEKLRINSLIDWLFKNKKD